MSSRVHPEEISTSRQLEFIVERLERKLGRFDQDLVDLRMVLEEVRGDADCIESLRAQIRELLREIGDLESQL